MLFGVLGGDLAPALTLRGGLKPTKEPLHASLTHAILPWCKENLCIGFSGALFTIFSSSNSSAAELVQHSGQHCYVSTQCALVPCWGHPCPAAALCLLFLFYHRITESQIWDEPCSDLALLPRVAFPTLVAFPSFSPAARPASHVHQC